MSTTNATEQALLTRRGSAFRLWPTLRRHPLRFGLTMLANAGAQVGAVAAAAIGAWIVGLVAAGRPAVDLATPSVLLAAAVIIRSASVWLESWVAHELAYRIMADLRIDVFDGLERLAPGWLLGRRTGDVGAAAMSDVENLEWFYAHTVAQVAVTIVILPVTLVALSTIDGRLALVMIAFVALVGTVPYWLADRADRQGEMLRTRSASLAADAVDGIQGLRELVMFSAAETYRTRLRSRSEELVGAQRAHGGRGGIEAGFTELFVSGGMIAVLAVGARFTSTGDLPIEMYLAAVLLAGSALGSITDVMGGIRNLGVLRATASRVFTIVDTPARVVDAPDATRRPDLPATIEFDDVHFGYHEDAAEVLRGVSFRIEAGETVALVGASGAGKTTCVNLLMRFWDVSSGSIRVAGTDVRHMTQAELRDLVGLVEQDPYLFNTTIEDNIRLGAPDADSAEVIAAASRAQICEFTESLPSGMATVVGERGARLSGGQRQRIAIARALVRDTPILVLDEALSSVDAEGERLVRAATEEARRGRTTVIIAHRLSTIRDASRVVMLADGAVCASGSHEELLESSVEYRRLVQTQLTPRPEG